MNPNTLADLSRFFIIQPDAQPERPSIEDILRNQPNALFVNALEKDLVITRIVDASSQGSLTDEDARRLIADLKRCKPTTPPEIYFEMEDVLDCYLVNNLAGGMINTIYDRWTQG